MNQHSIDDVKRCYHLLKDVEKEFFEQQFNQLIRINHELPFSMSASHTLDLTQIRFNINFDDRG